MPIFSDTFVVLIILSIIIIISIYATKTKVGKYLGTALLIIFFTALVANFKMDELKAIENKGWVSLVICERKEPSEKGATHYAYENTYEPPKQETVDNTKTEEDLPF